MAEEASISALMDRVARTAPFHRELAKLGTEEQAVFDHTSLPGVPFVAALCIRTLPDTARAWVVAPHLRAQEALAAQLETWGCVHSVTCSFRKKRWPWGRKWGTRSSPRNV
jgi:transcription-repair coupling factor (superfamily II helicase)